MENYRMDIRADASQITNIETAHFILLSLYREYSKHLLNNIGDKDDCILKMRGIKHDIRYLTGNELITKAQTLYLPILQNMNKSTK